MPKFKPESSDPATPGQAVQPSNWSGAVSKIISRIRPGGGVVNLKVNDEGYTELWEDESGFSANLDADPDTGFEMFDDPTTELWDPPTPGSGAALAHQPSPEDDAHIAEGLAKIAKADGITDASNIAIDLLLKHVPAESGSVLVKEDDQLRFVAVRGPKSRQIIDRTLKADQGVAGVALQTGNTLLIRRAHTNAQHDSSLDRSLNHLTRTILAIPLVHLGEGLGVWELLNPFGDDTFSPRHQSLANKVCGALALRIYRHTQSAHQG